MVCSCWLFQIMIGFVEIAKTLASAGCSVRVVHTPSDSLADNDSLASVAPGRSFTGTILDHVASEVVAILRTMLYSSMDITLNIAYMIRMAASDIVTYQTPAGYITECIEC